MITKGDLQQEIEQLDEHYLELVFKLLQQFPHQTQTKPDLLKCSRPIYYPNIENSKVEPIFTDIEDAASYGKQLRASAWQRNQHHD